MHVPQEHFVVNPHRVAILFCGVARLGANIIKTEQPEMIISIVLLSSYALL